MVVVQRVVVRNADQRGQLENRARLQMDMVEMQALDADRAQRFREHRQFGREREIEREAFAGARPRQLDRIADRRLQKQHFAARIRQRDQVVHVAANAAAPRVRYEHEDPLPRLRKPQEVDPARERSPRVRVRPAPFSARDRKDRAWRAPVRRGGQVRRLRARRTTRDPRGRRRRRRRARWPYPALPARRQKSISTP